MAKLGSKLDNDWLSLVLTVGRVDEWRPSSLVLVQAAWACDIYVAHVGSIGWDHCGTSAVLSLLDGSRESRLLDSE